MFSFGPYLLFGGNCAEAMSFYKSCFGGELSFLKVKDSPMKDAMPEQLQNSIVNARLKSGPIDISASDWLRLDRIPRQGNMVCLFISGGAFEELKTFFDRLSGVQVLLILWKRSSLGCMVL